MENQDLIFKKYVEYEVDFDYLEENVKFLIISSHKKVNSSFWELMHFFADKKIIEPVYKTFSDIWVKCEECEYTIECKNFIARQVLTTLLNLQKEKESIYTSWYLYDHDSCNEMPQFISSFFLADNNKIILDHVAISTSWLDKCDPNILIESSLVKCLESSTPLWNNMEKDQKAIMLWYYQKFHKETRRGQILSIRETLGSQKTKAYSSLSYQANQSSLLQSINKNLEWVVIILGIILVKMFL